MWDHRLLLYCCLGWKHLWVTHGVLTEHQYKQPCTHSNKFYNYNSHVHTNDTFRNNNLPHTQWGMKWGNYSTVYNQLTTVYLFCLYTIPTATVHGIFCWLNLPGELTSADVVSVFSTWCLELTSWNSTRKALTDMWEWSCSLFAYAINTKFSLSSLMIL